MTLARAMARQPARRELAAATRPAALQAMARHGLSHPAELALSRYALNPQRSQGKPAQAQVP